MKNDTNFGLIWQLDVFISIFNFPSCEARGKTEIQTIMPTSFCLCLFVMILKSFIIKAFFGEKQDKITNFGLVNPTQKPIQNISNVNLLYVT